MVDAHTASKMGGRQWISLSFILHDFAEICHNLLAGKLGKVQELSARLLLIAERMRNSVPPVKDETKSARMALQ